MPYLIFKFGVVSPEFLKLWCDAVFNYIEISIFQLGYLRFQSFDFYLLGNKIHSLRYIEGGVISLCLICMINTKLLNCQWGCFCVKTATHIACLCLCANINWDEIQSEIWWWNVKAMIIILCTVYDIDIHGLLMGEKHCIWRFFQIF